MMEINANRSNLDEVLKATLRIGASVIHLTAIRTVPYDMLDFDELNLPEVMEDIAEEEKGLVERTKAIAEGKLHYGMQTFGQCLFDLYNRELITYEQATNKDDLALRIRA